MGFRFRRSIKIAPGIRLNLGKRGISTTLGGRGASVNIGRKGVYANTGIPGTGLSYRSKLGGGEESRPVSGDGGDGTANGCAGCGCLAVLGLCLVLMVGMCRNPGQPRPSDPLAVAESAAPAAPSAESFYLHGAMNVRSGPGTAYAVTQTLNRGAEVMLGPKDAHGWAPIFIAGALAGYLYRSSDLVRSSPPPAPQPVPVRNSPASGYYRGPRGGCYTYSASGRKTYVDHSYCG
jgi:hypothetical protein